MPAPAKAPVFDITQAVLRAWTINDEINRYLLDKGSRKSMRRADPPGGKGRNIAAIFATSTTCV